jgi:hypothetical protein
MALAVSARERFARGRAPLIELAGVEQLYRMGKLDCRALREPR